MNKGDRDTKSAGTAGDAVVKCAPFICILSNEPYAECFCDARQKARERNIILDPRADS
ncbi:hypothetical protein CCP2SC5_280036 [Azospirillaceae bacterium]